MTRKILAVCFDNCWYLSPEFNGDKKEFEAIGSMDSCWITWEQINQALCLISSPEDFQVTIDMISHHYRSFCTTAPVHAEIQKMDTVAFEQFLSTPDGSKVVQLQPFFVPILFDRQARAFEVFGIPMKTVNSRLCVRVVAESEEIANQIVREHF